MPDPPETPNTGKPNTGRMLAITSEPPVSMRQRLRQRREIRQLRRKFREEFSKENEMRLQVWEPPVSMDHTRAREHQSLLRLAMAARTDHEQGCGCDGDRCEIGDALAKLDADR